MPSSNGQEELNGTAAEPWNSEEEKARYKKVKLASGGKTAIRNARRKAETHELESRRYERLSRVDWRKVDGAMDDGARDQANGFYLTYGPAENDMRAQADLTWKTSGQETMLHRHAKGEPCREVGEGAGCEWVGPKTTG